MVSTTEDPNSNQTQAHIHNVDNNGNFYEVKWEIAGWKDWVSKDRVYKIDESTGRPRRCNRVAEAALDNKKSTEDTPKKKRKKKKSPTTKTNKVRFGSSVLPAIKTPAPN